MRVAALYDIHGNLPALDAVLDELRDAGVDRVVVGGDVVPGPMPRECFARLAALDVPVHYLTGNGDRVVRALMNGAEPTEVPPPYRDAMRWVAEQLDDAHERFIASWPATLRLAIPGLGDVLFCHATPRNDTDIFTRLTPEPALRPLFDGVGVATVVCGHTHMPFDRTVGAVRVVNAGSVGMPFGAPGADWLLLGPGVEPRHTTYDLAAAAERIRGTSYPGAAELAARNVLAPPAEADMVAAFEKAAVR
jgi:predicted phosphodiesterase